MCCGLGNPPHPTHERAHTKRERDLKLVRKNKLKVETKQFLDNYFHKTSSSKSPMFKKYIRPIPDVLGLQQLSVMEVHLMSTPS